MFGWVLAAGKNNFFKGKYKMKKIVLLLAMLVCGMVFAVTAYNGVASIPAGTENSVIKFTFATITDDETVTFKLNGTAKRIVVKTTANDADGTLAIKDISDVNYVSFTATTFSASSTVPVDLVISCVDNSSNSYGGIPVAGYSTMHLVNMAGAGATTIYLYVDRK